MGFQAILDDGSVIAPAVDVIDGLLKASQANDQFKGVTGMCPHCKELRDAQHGTDNLQVQHALSIADLTVRFRRAVLNGEQMLRVMHFAHRAGFLSSPGACLLCRDNQLAHHAAAVKVIGRWAERQWPRCTVRAEMQILVPGAPPVQFRPDISVLDATGRRVACIEYQRTKESFDSFKARDELRCKEFDEVLWFFREGAYRNSSDHRDHLADRGRRFFLAFIEPKTGQLKYKEGARPSRRNLQDASHQLNACSESSLLQALTPPSAVPNGGRLEINTFLEMEEVKPNNTGTMHTQQARAWRGKPEEKREREELLGFLRTQREKEYLDNIYLDGIREDIREDSWRLLERQRMQDWQVAIDRQAAERKALLGTPLGRIQEARRRRVPPNPADRIELAIENRNWTPFDIQRWDHEQGFGVILGIRQIENFLKRRNK